MLTGKADMAIAMFGTNTFRGYESLTTSIAYFNVKVVFAVPRGRQVSNVEKLLLPFRYIIWSCIVVCFGSGLLLVLALRLFRREVRRFVLGRHNRHPLITMINVWLGNSVDRLPGRNFSRFLLMSWILLAFVLRSAYQGALFDILRLKKSIAPVNTVQKIAAANYDVYVSTRLEKYVRQMDDKIQPLVKVVRTNQIDGLLMNTLDTSFNGVVVVVEPTILHFNKYKVPKGFQLIHSPVVIHSIQNSIYVTKGSCLLPAIDQELWMYLSSGLIYSWATNFLKRGIRDEKSGKTVQPLGLPDVMGIFQVYGILMGVSVVVFIGEVYWNWRKRTLMRRKKVMTRNSIVLNKGPLFVGH